VRAPNLPPYTPRTFTERQKKKVVVQLVSYYRSITRNSDDIISNLQYMEKLAVADRKTVKCCR
jgi:hypothetical protein